MSSSTSNEPRSAGDRYDAGFFSAGELELIEQFESRGYVIANIDTDSEDELGRIRRATADAFASEVGTDAGSEVTPLLDGAAAHVAPGDLNRVRLRIFNALSAQAWMRPSYYRLARSTLHALVGNELAMQRRVNLSIQLPDDDSSLLPVHSDVWSGDSPYELVVWLPLVDCYRTKSMYILPREASARHASRLAEHGKLGSEALYATIEPDLEWIDIRVGQVLVFTHTLMHGNRVNREATTRWSMNCRFKSLLSPYDTKRLGEFFEPITIRAATRLGMSYEPPTGFER